MTLMSHTSQKKKKHADLRVASSSSQGGVKAPPGPPSQRNTAKGRGAGPPWPQKASPELPGMPPAHMRSVREHKQSHVHKRGEKEQRGCFSASVWIYLQATVSDSTAAIVKLCFSLFYYLKITPISKLTPIRK